MENAIKIDKIVIDINGQKIEITVDEARELKEVLEDMFGSDESKEVTYIPQPYVPSAPISPYISYRWYVSNYEVENMRNITISYKTE